MMNKASYRTLLSQVHIPFLQTAYSIEILISVNLLEKFPI